MVRKHMMYFATVVAIQRNIQVYTLLTASFDPR